MSNTPLRLMTVDDHPIYRGGLASLIAAYPDFLLIAEASNGREAVEVFRRHRPDVTMMDLSMPIMGGVHLHHRGRVSRGPDHCADHLGR